MSSESEDDVPLRSRQKALPNANTRMMKPDRPDVVATALDESDDDDDDVPLSQMKSKLPDVLDASDDDDDVPLAALTTTTTTPAPPAAPQPPHLHLKKRKRQNSELDHKKKPKTKEGRSSSKDISSNTTSSSSIVVFTQQKCSESLYKTDKGRLVQELLCRWWYVLEWPKKTTDEFLEQQPPNHQGLDGFPGTFISVKGDDMGSILDRRTYAGKPTFINLFAKPAAELKDLLLKAYRNQIQALIEHEGEAAPLLKELRRAMKSAETISVDKADKQAKKKLKKWKKHAAALARLQQQSS